MPKVLVVDDDADILDLIKHSFLIRDFTVLEAQNGEDGIALCKKECPDLLILDLSLPDMDGVAVCQALKQNSHTQEIPILMLTGRTSVVDRVKGLETGADDYLTKPFDPLELFARAKVLLRRNKKAQGESRTPVKMGDIRIDPDNYKLEINGKSIDDLTPKEFDILYLLIKNSPKPVTRDDIYQNIWGKSKKGKTRVIDIHVAKVRKKIGEKYIKTIPAKGYFFTAA